jgi:hypothetical protein
METKNTSQVKKDAVAGIFGNIQIENLALFVNPVIFSMMTNEKKVYFIYLF